MFRKNITLLSICLLILGGLTNCGQNNKSAGQKADHATSDSVQTLTDNGAWCWFSDPRAIYYSDNQIITGWVKNDGSVEIASLNLETQQKEFQNIYPQMEIDDHDNPAFTVLPDGNVFTMFAWHSSKKGIIYNQTTEGADINTFGKNVVYMPRTEELLKQFPHETYTYANPYILEKENNKLFAFGRWIGYKPNMIISSDNGNTWEEQYVVISSKPFDANNRPYVKYYSDGQSKIHLVFTDGHPRVEPENSVYYCYYENRAFWRADGTKICDLSGLPFTTHDASLVYQASEEQGRAWIADIVEKDGTPFILYSRHPKETDHRYHYAYYNKAEKKWEDVEICKAGKWFPQTQPGETEREQHYMGNMTFHPLNPNTVYLSREVEGTFEIEKFKTKDSGATWEITPITTHSVYDNVRPYVPRYQTKNAKTVILWMENKKYIHYTNYDSQIKYYIDPEL
ncbi:hypothetical protein D1164_05340 [Mariniphaga sediminis]|uniref:Exo-alpha-sialidase n=1 Tax=Mariniphaga sediminis TaxID=1628158 RepID=A0A399D307_9BACT|nr:BNR-4 repeat-containing protein [Mariniphaga sediminis]RIH66335.1 hypothetical protein D1164_05340 [Mariniphaga sediminis]